MARPYSLVRGLHGESYRKVAATFGVSVASVGEVGRSGSALFPMSAPFRPRGGGLNPCRIAPKEELIALMMNPGAGPAGLLPAALPFSDTPRSRSAA